MRAATGSAPPQEVRHSLRGMLCCRRRFALPGRDASHLPTPPGFGSSLRIFLPSPTSSSSSSLSPPAPNVAKVRRRIQRCSRRRPFAIRFRKFATATRAAPGAGTGLNLAAGPYPLPVPPHPFPLPSPFPFPTSPSSLPRCRGESAAAEAQAAAVLAGRLRSAVAVPVLPLPPRRVAAPQLRAMPPGLR